jgi:hypothetical protein
MPRPQELPGPRSNYRDVPYPGAVHNKGGVKYVGAVQVTHLATEHRAANSTDSTSTAHEAAAQGPGGDIVAPILSPLRQISLDVIAATAALGRPMPERQNLFQDVLEQVRGWGAGGRALAVAPWAAAAALPGAILLGLLPGRNAVPNHPSAPPSPAPACSWQPLPGERRFNSALGTEFSFSILAHRGVGKSWLSGRNSRQIH